MNEFRRITTAALDEETAARVERQAHDRGLSVEDYAALAVKSYADEFEAFQAFIAQGEASIDRGDYLTQEEMRANLRQWRETRQRPA